MKNMILILISCVVLSGCSLFAKKERVIVKTVEVKVPVYQCPGELIGNEVPERERLLIEDLTDSDVNDPGKVAKAYRGSLLQQRKRIDLLESIIDDIVIGCKKQATDK